MGKNIAIVIVTHNSESVIGRLLEHILSQSVKVNNVIIVDTASNDQTVSVINHYRKAINITLHITRENIGGAGGFNIGLKEAIHLSSDFVITLDDDAVLEDDDFINILLSKKYEYDLDIVSPIVVDIKNRSKTAFLYNVEGIKYSDLDKVKQHKIIKGDLKLFNGALFDCNAIKEIGYPDPVFFIRGDEVEYKKRIIKSGFKVGIVTEGEIFHPTSLNEIFEVGNKVFYHIDNKIKNFFSVRNKFYMYRKNLKGFKRTRKIFIEIVSYIFFYLIHRKLDFRGCYNYFIASFFGVFGLMRNDLKFLNRFLL
ncbi:glycosyltransferase [Mannheimia sp. HC-2023]|uniref:glycosyltransferase n=1 Tax=Mannheimia indoligenes TaxID=3103145 RepID=UPI002FE591A0